MTCSQEEEGSPGSALTKEKQERVCSVAIRHQKIHTGAPCHEKFSSVSCSWRCFFWRQIPGAVHDGHSSVSPLSDTEPGILFIQPRRAARREQGQWSAMSIQVPLPRALPGIPHLQKSLWVLVCSLPSSFQEANLLRWLHVFRICHADSLSRACGFYWQRFENFQIMDENFD